MLPYQLTVLTTGTIHRLTCLAEDRPRGSIEDAFVMEARDNVDLGGGVTIERQLLLGVMKPN